MLQGEGRQVPAVPCSQAALCHSPVTCSLWHGDVQGTGQDGDVQGTGQLYGAHTASCSAEEVTAREGTLLCQSLLQIPICSEAEAIRFVLRK